MSQELPTGTVCSDIFHYEQKGLWQQSNLLYIGQTEYFGIEQVIFAYNPVVIKHTSKDYTT